jgi:hypothetical protein
MLLRRSAGVFSPNIDAMQVGQRDVRGQKRVEDARKRAYAPRIHLFLLAKMDELPGRAWQ